MHFQIQPRSTKGLEPVFGSPETELGGHFRGMETLVPGLHCVGYWEARQSPWTDFVELPSQADMGAHCVHLARFGAQQRAICPGLLKGHWGGCARRSGWDESWCWEPVKEEQSAHQVCRRASPRVVESPRVSQGTSKQLAGLAITHLASHRC